MKAKSAAIPSFLIAIALGVYYDSRRADCPSDYIVEQVCRIAELVGENAAENVALIVGELVAHSV